LGGWRRRIAQHFTKEDVGRLRTVSAGLGRVLEDARVTGVFVGPSWVSVNKVAGVDWAASGLGDEVERQVQEATAPAAAFRVEGLEDGAAAGMGGLGVGEEEEESEVVAALREVLDERVRPSVQADGGDVEFLSFDSLTGTVRLRLAGSCVGCSHSAETLKGGIERMLTYYVPEVRVVEHVAYTELDRVNESAFRDLERKLQSPDEAVDVMRA
jgi:NFU1 iron-sulfur cluster scaffold homolog, mitochondrial